jgi:hypothetical protein
MDLSYAELAIVLDESSPKVLELTSIETGGHIVVRLSLIIRH